MTMDNDFKINTPQVKVCGLTKIEEAEKCIELGVDAIGLVFFKNSPRYVSVKKASDICKSLPKETPTVGVFVNEPFNSIMDIATSCNLTAIQLHGNENPKFVKDLINQGITVVKMLYMEGQPSINQVNTYNASAYLIECAKGSLPGGNAMAWNWQDSAEFAATHPMILAGGLSPDNVGYAIEQATPDAVDVSSGVELFPGKKDIHKIKKFLKAVRGCKPDRNLRRIF